MFVQTYPQAAEFLAAAQPFLEQDEITNSLILGASLRLQARGRSSRRRPPFLATAVSDSDVVAAAMLLPPHRLLLACPTAARTPLRLLTDLLLQTETAVSGTLAPAAVAEAMARQWTAQTGESSEVRMRQRLFVLHEVIAPVWPNGRFRPARLDDVELVADWVHAFQTEALPHETADMQAARMLATNLLQTGGLFVWDDGSGPVCMAAQARPTRRGSALNLVYTPPEKRGRGYASACVASLSQHLLDEGFHFCTLFTDQANPTSNRIYQAIGYQAVTDFLDIGFKSPADPSAAPST
jgi:uncharacterized protein